MEQRTRRWLICLLAVGGVIQLSALPAIFFPFSWMAAIHASLGLGPLPDQPIVGYLTRSLSLVYTLWGGLFLFVLTDLDRYLPLVRFLACLKLLLGVGLFALDLAAHMPWLWTLAEGPIVLAYAFVLLWLTTCGKFRSAT